MNAIRGVKFASNTLVQNDNYEYDKSVGKILSYYLFINMLNIVIKQVFSQSTFIVSYITPILGLSYLIMLCKEYRTVIRVFPNLLFCEMIFVVLLLYSTVMYSGNAGEIFSRCVWTIMFCIPMYVMFQRVNSIRTVISETKYVNIVLLALYVYGYMIVYSRTNNEYSMSMSYAILFSTLYHISQCKKNILYIVFITIEVTLIFISGSRGPLICIAVFSALKFLFMPNKRISTVMTKMLLFTGIILIVAFYEQILASIYDAFITNGVYSRTLYVLMNRGITYNSGRSEIWETAWRLISKRPVFGWGIAADISLMSTYPHQVVLEILLHFGFVLGTALIAYFAYKTISSLIISRKDDSVLMFTCCGLLPLFFSSTYLQSPLAWILIAICSNRKHRDTLNTAENRKRYHHIEIERARF